MSEKTIRVKVSTNRIGSEDYSDFTIDAEEWDEMDESERKEVCLEQMFELIEWDYEEVSE